MEKVKPWNDIRLIIIACLTIGLTPYMPEPHIVGKLRWIMGGAVGMQFMDWVDVLMHGLPWAFLLRWLIKKIFNT